MRLLRLFFIVVALCATFFYLTTYRSSHLWPTSAISRPDRVDIIEAAGGGADDAEEQNNISVYRKNIESVVNITSEKYPLIFSMGCNPPRARDQGSLSIKRGIS